MRISDLTQEERKAFEAHLLSTYRYDAATGKLINKKWNREYPGVIKDNGYVYVWVFFRGEQFRIRKHRDTETPTGIFPCTPSFSQGNRPLERYQDRQPY